MCSLSFPFGIKEITLICLLFIRETNIDHSSFQYNFIAASRWIAEILYNSGFRYKFNIHVTQYSVIVVATGFVRWTWTARELFCDSKAEG